MNTQVNTQHCSTNLQRLSAQGRDILAEIMEEKSVISLMAAISLAPLLPDHGKALADTSRAYNALSEAYRNGN